MRQHVAVGSAATASRIAQGACRATRSMCDLGRNERHNSVHSSSEETSESAYARSGSAPRSVAEPPPIGKRGIAFNMAAWPSVVRSIAATTSELARAASLFQCGIQRGKVGLGRLFDIGHLRFGRIGLDCWQRDSRVTPSSPTRCHRWGTGRPHRQVRTPKDTSSVKDQSNHRSW